ncbi:unnamed protein product [Pipistrellus nathusii]|uniref:Uncharacterized protein n=1 Tax=Pipistrellus nathusii TaxID=59473 RepID=A0ABP0ACM1_PIPNA
MREKHRSAASCTPPTGDVPATKIHALDQNRTQDLSVHRLTLYSLSQTSFGYRYYFYTTLWRSYFGKVEPNLEKLVGFWQVEMEKRVCSLRGSKPSEGAERSDVRAQSPVEGVQVAHYQ